MYSNVLFFKKNSTAVADTVVYTTVEATAVFGLKIEIKIGFAKIVCVHILPWYKLCKKITRAGSSSLVSRKEPTP